MDVIRHTPYTFPYVRKIVRDLAWVISGEPLLRELPDEADIILLPPDFFREAEIRMLPLLKQLDDNPAPLAAFIEAGNTAIIGKYFERLVEFWFLHDPDIELLKANLQVAARGRTTGEFDFIAKVHGQLLHIEAAGKFYLSEKNEPQWDSLTGPNGLDRLSIKMGKVISHQSRLAASPEGKDALRDSGIDEAPQPALMLKGYFFYPRPALLQGAINMPEGSNRHHYRGSWFRAAERRKYIELRSHYYVLQRHQWVSGLAFAEPDELLAGGELLKFLDRYFTGNHYPLLIAAMHESGEAWFETERCFIVGDRWPEVEAG